MNLGPRRLWAITYTIVCCLCRVVHANQENNDYFDASTITEYSHFLFGTVGQSGFMRLSNPVLDANTNQWGSDKEESSTSQTKLVTRSEFEQVGDNQFYQYHATYVMPENSVLQYQYLYFDFLPLGSTLDQPQPSVVSRNYFSFWIKSSAAQRCRVQLQFSNGDKEKSDFFDVPESSTLANLKVPVSEVGASVEKVTLSIVNAVSGEQTLDIALLAFSDVPDVITTIPSTQTLDPDDPFDTVPAPSDCLAHYPDFLNEITPYAMYRVTDQVPNESRHNLGVLETGGTITSQTLEWRTTGQHLAGVFSVKTEFTLPPTSYIYFHNFQGSKKLLDEAPQPVNASDFGTHFCLWIRFPENQSIDLTLFSDSTHQSSKRIYRTSSDWSNECLEVSSMQPKRPTDDPVDLASLSQIFVGFTNQDVSTNSYVLEYTMIYFTNEPKIYTVMPAVVSPGFILREDGNGGCEYVSGPDQDTIPPSGNPQKTPLSAYRGSYDTDFQMDNRLAVFVIDDDSHWLALVHALRILGIPLVVTTNVNDAIRHKTVLVYPDANDDRLSQNESRKLAKHSQSNTVIFNRLGTERLHRRLRRACGVDKTEESNGEYSHLKFEPNVTFSPAALFGCEVGPRLADYHCPSGIKDSERYVKIWEDWRGPYYNYGLGRLAQRIKVREGVDTIATYTTRTPKLSTDGEIMYRDEFPIYTEEDTADVAVSRNSGESGGFCYVVGIDLGKLCSDSRNYDFGGMSRTYSSSYEPGIDMLIRMIKNIYTFGQEAVSLHPIPHGKRLAVMYTHDVDANTPSLWRLYGEEEKKAGIKSTFFLYTKIERDDYDVPFYIENEETLVDLAKMGHELASHSVSHSPNFFDWWPEYTDFGLGTGTEQYSYGTGYAPNIHCTDASQLFLEHPFSGDTISICDHPYFERSTLVCNYWRRMNGSDEKFTCGLYRTDGGSVLGELRVSKFLIDSVYDKAGISGKQVRAFRPGHLKYPATLNEALVATGYTVSSINQANELATHQYFRLLFGHDGAGRDPETASGVDAFELPIQFEDTVSWPLRATYSNVQSDHDMATHTHHTAARIAKFGGIVVVLTHPTDEFKSKDGLLYTGKHKIEWEIEHAENIKEYASFLTMSEMGDFAAARDEVEVDFMQEASGEYVIELKLPLDITGLTIEVPSAWECSGNSITTQMEDHLDSSRRLVVFGELAAGTYLISCE